MINDKIKADYSNKRYKRAFSSEQTNQNIEIIDCEANSVPSMNTDLISVANLPISPIIPVREVRKEVEKMNSMHLVRS